LKATTGFKHHQASKAIVDLIDMVHLVEHGLAGYVEDATRDDFAYLAFAMHIDHLQRFLPAYDALPYLMYQPHGWSLS
jgi:hypothetical protein